MFCFLTGLHILHSERNSSVSKLYYVFPSWFILKGLNLLCDLWGNQINPVILHEWMSVGSDSRYTYNRYMYIRKNMVVGLMSLSLAFLGLRHWTAENQWFSMKGICCFPAQLYQRGHVLQSVQVLVWTEVWGKLMELKHSQCSAVCFCTNLPYLQ